MMLDENCKAPVCFLFILDSVWPSQVLTFFTECCVANMHLYSEQHIIYGDYAFQQWDAELVADLLKEVNPYNMRIDLVSKNFDKNRPGIHTLSFLYTMYCVHLSGST